ncbi:tRNA (adenosine(37)-N6)-threonylcarbamoyltransferase complex dimerization subunit type 1 TsaB [Luteolibacter algae]|uniref:tRNA (Adenosine(37)-N6)-threonylcarbamoyltransferase complex dimerization subunit type 1 TsaB n=1 Tax=Luteolibacter algae TaxID=454151 RepID=A0ABW5D8L1_9BACT
MSAVLIIETSTDAASIALANEGEIICEKSFISDRRHNALLFEPLAEILAAHGTRSFDAVLVGSGPGSYSGTRVGIAAAQGAALVGDAKAVAVPSILATPEALSGNPCMAVGDARRGSYWTAQINEGQLISGPDLTDSFGFEAALLSAEQQGISVFCMEGIRGHSLPVAKPSAAGIWAAWKAASPKTRALWAGQIAQPIYLKPPHITPSKRKPLVNPA